MRTTLVVGNLGVRVGPAHADVAVVAHQPRNDVSIKWTINDRGIVNPNGKLMLKQQRFENPNGDFAVRTGVYKAGTDVPADFATDTGDTCPSERVGARQ